MDYTMSYITNKEYYLEVARGNVPGASIINKFGHNPLVPTTGADIWGGLGLYEFYPTSGQNMEIVSTDADDTNLGDGAWTVIVFGLDDNGLEVDEIVEMDGLNPVALTAHQYTAVYRAVVLTANGPTLTNVGAISIQISGGGTLAAFIGIDDGQTQMTHYTIPANKHGFFIEGYVALGNDDKNGVGATFQWLSKSPGVNGAWAVKGQAPLVNIGSSHFIYEYGAPAGVLPSLSSVKIRCTVADSISDGIGGYDLILYDN
jgi:hypothetical protein